MESNVLDERIDWEARRVAAAFGVAEWSAFEFDDGWEFNGIGRGDSLVAWGIDGSTAQWLGSEVGPKESAVDNQGKKHWELCCQVWRHPEIALFWECSPHPLFNKFMAYGLSYFGFEEKDVLAELNHPLSAHEKLELRLSMPREFWSQKWLDEENAS